MLLRKPMLAQTTILALLSRFFLSVLDGIFLLLRRFLYCTLLERLPVAFQPGNSILPPDSQFRLHYLRGTIMVIIPDALFTANRPSKREDLRFVQFSFAITAEKKQALGFPGHNPTSIPQLRDLAYTNCIPLVALARLSALFHFPGANRIPRFAPVFRCMLRAIVNSLFPEQHLGSLLRQT